MERSEQVEIDDARRMVLESLGTLPLQELELDDALGRVLGEDVRAERELPPFDSSAMDGFAVRAQDLSSVTAQEPVSLRVIGEARAGRPAQASVERGQAIAISTGAMLPAGADTIVRLERTRREDGVVHVLEPVTPGSEVRRAGEDVPAGKLVLTRGATLEPAAIGMLAALGRARVRCVRAPRISVLVTGDELLDPGEEPRAGAIADSNSHSICALARCSGGEILRSVRVADELAATSEAIARAREDADLIVICGGVSVGEHDHVRAGLRALGARKRFWGLALRPGHPTWFGSLDGVPVFGLPGNPVSAMVTFILLAAPAMRAMRGASVEGLRARAILDEDYEKPAGRAHAVRCRVRVADDGWHASPTGPQGSHVLSSMLDADALAIVPARATRVSAGERVEMVPLRPWLGARA